MRISKVLRRYEGRHRAPESDVTPEPKPKGRALRAAAKIGPLVTGVYFLAVSASSGEQTGGKLQNTAATVAEKASTVVSQTSQKTTAHASEVFVDRLQHAREVTLIGSGVILVSAALLALGLGGLAYALRKRQRHYEDDWSLFDEEYASTSDDPGEVTREIDTREYRQAVLVHGGHSVEQDAIVEDTPVEDVHIEDVPLQGATTNDSWSLRLDGYRRWRREACRPVGRLATPTEYITPIPEE